MESVGIILTTRVKSTRLKNKVLQKINGKTCFEILLDRLQNNRYPVVVATPESKENDILVEMAEKKGFETYRGFDDSPLHRITNCAKLFDFDHVVRITHDDILIDQIIMFNQIKFHINGKNDYTYCRQIPEGCAGEVIKTSVLEEVVEKVGEKPIEFISYYVKHGYKTFEYYPPREYQHQYRLTMDYEEDLTLLRLIFASLPEPIGTLDIINFIKQHKYFLNINRLPETTIYTCNYNTAKYVTDTIESVVNQNYDDYEFIIIDDNSTDNSMNVIIEKISKLNLDDRKKISVYRNDQNKGLASCSNMALEKARGKYIIRIDSDDIIHQDAVERMIEQVRLDDTQACLTGYYTTEEQLSITSEIVENMWHPACAIISTWSANEIKYQDGLVYLEGQDFWARFNEKYSVSFIGEPLWLYRSRPGQKTKEKDHPNNSITKEPICPSDEFVKETERKRKKYIEDLS